jgi:tRNA threonylcarbamoyladenosine biosynthesis protein TsaB
MIVLAFDTAMAACSVAVWRDGATLASTQQLMERGQAEHLVPMIAEAMGAAGVGFDELDRIAVTVGPGSFTGVRVALATARGLALAHKLPVIGLTTGQVLAATAASRNSGASAFVSLIDSKRGDVYVERFTATGAAMETAQSIPGADVGAWISQHCPTGLIGIVGDGAHTAPPDARITILNDVIYPDAAMLAARAALCTPGPSPVPLYVRPPDVTMPRVS